jgi:hypothetical protein
VNSATNFDANPSAKKRLEIIPGNGLSMERRNGRRAIAGSRGFGGTEYVDLQSGIAAGAIDP